MSREYVGVLIGRQDLGETDRVLRFLTPDVGRLSVVARGARRPRSPFATADLGSRVRITVEEGPWELQRLQGLELEEARVGLRADLDRLYGMLHLCECSAALSREQVPEPRLYGLLEMALLLLEHGEGAAGPAFFRAFEAKALSFAGLTPVLATCPVCRQKLHDPLVWVEGTGAAHRDCGGGEPISGAWVDAVEAGRRQPLKEVFGRPLPPGPWDLLIRMIEAQLGRPLGSRLAGPAVLG